MWIWRWWCAGCQRRCVRGHFSLLVAVKIGVGMMTDAGRVATIAADEVQPQAPSRFWLMPMPPMPAIDVPVPDRSMTLQDHLMTVDRLLRQRQPRAAALYADQLIERRPQATMVHVMIARLFSRHQQCQPAKFYFRRLRQLFWAGPQRHMLRQIEQACGDLWVASYTIQWRGGYKQALFDAPLTNRLIPEPGSQLDLLCQQLARLCNTQSWTIPTAAARGGRFSRLSVAAAMMRPAWNGNLHQFKITTAATRTSRPDVGDDALAMAYEIRRHLTGDKAIAATVRLGSYWPQYGILGQDSDKSWRGLDLQFYRAGKQRQTASMTGLSIERFTGRGSRLRRRYDLDSLGVTFKFALTMRPVPAWHMTLLHQYQQRHYARQRFYLASSHRTHAATTRLHFSTAIGPKGGTHLGVEISCYKVRSADRLAHRNHHDYTLVLSRRF
jgi:hypothetical protein